ncbi:MAG: tetratricopeptide repeat protein [Candidatus Sumerlaeia bacterium]
MLSNRLLVFSLALLFCGVCLKGMAADPVVDGDGLTSPVNWEAVYSRAHQMRSQDLDLSMEMFKQVATNAEEPLAGRAILQMALISRMLLMEPRISLEYYEAFESADNAKQHPSYVHAHQNTLNLKRWIGRVDELEEKLLVQDEDVNTTQVLMEIGRIYRESLSSDKYAFDAYKRTYDFSSKKYDVAYYMMGYCKHEMGAYVEATFIFQDFLERFPDSYLSESAIDMLYRSKYLRVYYLESAEEKKKEAKDLAEEMGKFLKENPDLDEGTQVKLKHMLKLLKTM